MPKFESLSHSRLLHLLTRLPEIPPEFLVLISIPSFQFYPLSLRLFNRTLSVYLSANLFKYLRVEAYLVQLRGSGFPFPQYLP